MSNQNPYATTNYGGISTNPNPQEWKQADIEVGFQDKLDIELTMRLGFIRKVYGILSFQLLLTTFMCTLSVVSKSYGDFQKNNPLLMWLSLIGSIIVLLAVCCIPGMARRVPTNYILLSAFTLFEGYLVSCACAVTSPRIVLMAATMTCAMTIGLTIYACTTKTDFTVFNSLLFVAALVLLLLGIFVMFTQNKVLHIIYCCLGVFIYSIYLIYDTQLLIGNKENALDVEDYILGAMMLYLDIINLFIYLLQILKAADR
jgi:FtsH-binding integral membrane protein